MRPTTRSAAIILVLGWIINTFGISPIRIINNVSAWWHMISAILLAIVLLAIPTRAPAPNRLICTRTTSSWRSTAQIPIRLWSLAGTLTPICVAQRNKTEQAAIPSRTANGTAARGQARRNRPPRYRHLGRGRANWPPCRHTNNANQDIEADVDFEK
jgi:Amino acid permease